MKKFILPFLLCLIFIGTAGIQFYENYLFRIQPPSKEWSKEVVISSGKTANTPKIIKYGDMYVVAHDDKDSIKLILLDKMGGIIKKKVFLGGDEQLFDINLLTDGDNIFINWVYSKGIVKNLVNLKLDKDFNQLEKWEIEDVRESYQVSDSLMAVCYPGKIEVIDMKTRKSSYVDVKFASKFASTKTKDGYLITYFDLQNFKYLTYKDGKLSGPELIMFRPASSREMFISTAVACDDKNGYIIIDRREKNVFGEASMITFPLEVDKNAARKLEGYGNYIYDPGVGTERGFRMSDYTDFTFSPLSVASGNEARFLIGVARSYGKSQRQFDIMDIKFKDGKVIENAFVDKTREGTTMPWISDDIVVFCNQTKLGQYDICIASQNEAFKKANNTPRLSEIKLALLDTLTSFANSVVGLFTISIRWILPVMLLMSFVTLFGYKLSIRNKKLVFLGLCITGGVLKIILAKNLFYGRYLNVLPDYLKPISKGLILFAVISIISYLLGYTKYKKALNKDPDVLPLFIFILAITIDSILTQFVYSPYIM